MLSEGWCADAAPVRSAAMTSTLIALAALLISLVGAGAAISSARSGSDSAGHAKDSADAAKRSADSSDVSARAAEKSAEADGQVARVELERDHDGYRPTGVTFRARGNPRNDEDLVFMVFMPTRSFRARGELVIKTETGESRSNLALGPAVEGNRVDEQFICTMSEYKVGKAEVHLRFWPPVEGDAGEAWTCACGRPVDPEGRAHWELRVPVDLGPGYDGLDTVR